MLDNKFIEDCGIISIIFPAVAVTANKLLYGAISHH